MLAFIHSLTHPACLFACLPAFLFSTVPINEIQEYLGEELGFYFAFLAFLTRCLATLAPIGILTEATAHAGHYLLHWGNHLYANGGFALAACPVYGLILESWRYDVSSTQFIFLDMKRPLSASSTAQPSSSLLDFLTPT